MRWLLLILLIASGMGFWFWYAPDSIPYDLGHKAQRAVDPNPPMYKWKNAKGEWQISDKPPATGKYETLRYDPETNVVPSGNEPPQ